MSCAPRVCQFRDTEDAAFDGHYDFFWSDEWLAQYSLPLSI
jgi:hypothetical protein